MLVRWQSDQVNTKEYAIPVCDKSYHTNKRWVQKEKEIEVLRNFAFHNCCLMSIDVDECVSNPCAAGRCMNAVNAFTCVCLEGYTGVLCETGTHLGFLGFILDSLYQNQYYNPHFLYMAASLFTKPSPHHSYLLHIFFTILPFLYRSILF